MHAVTVASSGAQTGSGDISKNQTWDGSVIENELPCVICVGEKIGAILRGVFQMRVLNKWEEGLDCHGNKIPNWPNGKTGPAKRKYELFVMEESSDPHFRDAIKGGKVLFLVISSTGSNKLPGRGFDEVESSLIVNYIRQVGCGR